MYPVLRKYIHYTYNEKQLTSFFLSYVKQKIIM